MNAAIETRGLDFSYGQKQVINDVDMRVPAGGIYGFLGPNGAGKTTLIRLLLGLLKPSAGTVSINGTSPAHGVMGPAGVGSMIETPSLYPNLTAVENLRVSSLTQGIEDEDHNAVLGRVGLATVPKQLVGTYSLGMKQRLSIALALQGAPHTLVLDEPMNGLDPEGIDELSRLLLSLRDRGLTILLSSHVLGDVERLATHIGIIRGGRLVFQGPIEDIRNDRIEVQCGDVDRATEVLLRMGMRIKASSEGRIMVRGDVDGAEVNRRLVMAGVAVSSLSAPKNALEEFYRDAA